MSEPRKKRPRDANQLAKAIVDIATGERDDNVPELTEAQRFAREGGKKGGVQRARTLTAERRREIAKQAALARWAAKSNR
jgi:hypothetical protein